MCARARETKLTCVTGFTGEARPLRLRRIKVTGKNQRGRQAPVCLFNTSALGKAQTQTPCSSRRLRRRAAAKVTLLVRTLQIRRGSVSISKTRGESPEKQMKEPSFTLSLSLFFCFCRVTPCHLIYPKQSASISSLQSHVSGDPAARRQTTLSF